MDKPVKAADDLWRAPWNNAMVEALEQYQNSGVFHPYTCANRGNSQHVLRPGRDIGQLTPTTAGWVCPDCDYMQDWAHALISWRDE